MSLYDQADSIDSRNTGNNSDPLLPEGDYPELAVLEIKEFRPTKEPHKHYWKCRHVVVSGPHKGKIASIMEQLEGNMYPEHGPQAMARVKKLIGQLFGLSDPEQINKQVTGQVIRGCFQQDGKIMAGKVFGATVVHKITGKNKAPGQQKTISKYDTRVTTGAKEVDVTAAQAEAARTDEAFGKAPSSPPPASAPMAAPPPAAFVPPPAVAPAAPSFPPAGWQVHPGGAAQGYFKPGMTKCISDGELRTLMAMGQA